MTINRNAYVQELVDKMHNGMIKVITGIRRCGKSYLLFHLFKEYLLSTGVKAKNIIEIALDDDENSAYRNPIELGKYIRSKIIDTKTDYYVFIDEIQFVKKVENPDLPGDFITFYEVLNGLLRHKNIDTYVTGSNSKMLSKDILTEFRGRGDQVHVYPLSFREFYSIQKKNADFSDVYAEYQMYGGLPYAALLNTDQKKSAYLKNLYDEVYLKDILQRNNIKNDYGLSTLVDILASSIGSFTNPSRIEKTFRSENQTTYDVKTITQHLEYFEDSFLISEAKRYNVKGRKYIGAVSKYYFTDVGLRNAKLNFRQIEPSHLMENIIYNELIVRGFSVDVGIVEINKVQFEVDFTASSGNKKFYIQSAYAMDSEEKTAQEKRPLEKIHDSFKKILIVNSIFKPFYDDNGFLTVSLKDFLLDDAAINL